MENSCVTLARYSAVLAFVGVCLMTIAPPIHAAQIDIAGPAGSVSFGASVTVLSNGNIVVTDPDASGSASMGGAIHLYTPGGVLISTLAGAGAGDRVGSGGVKLLANGNFVVLSPDWNSGGNGVSGAVTWVDGKAGLSGVVSVENSLLGATMDVFGGIDVTPLSNGNYVVSSPLWKNGSVANAGAVTWANGATGLSGVISADNSLVGVTEGDCVGGECDFGTGSVIASPNGNYLIVSSNWSNGAAVAAGAATWGDGTHGPVGVVSAANSVIGNTMNDRVGSLYVPALANGNFVVASPDWSNGTARRAGAVTWISGTTGGFGVVSATNSLVGVVENDQVGSEGITLLSGNGNYVVASPQWSSDASPSNHQRGAATWANGSQGVSGVVSSANSLVGSSGWETVGIGVTALSNGNYVVRSNLGLCGCGAVTWGDGGAGTNGLVSASNSLVGRLNDSIGTIVALTNGNYVVVSPYWGDGDGSAPQMGAVTWAIGDRPSTGLVTAANSLVGSQNGDRVGSEGVVALANGNYVVLSSYWHGNNGSYSGAVTWRDGHAGAAGIVSTSNSLTGTSIDGLTGEYSARVTALANGNFVVASPNWSRGSAPSVGAVTWGNGASGTAGEISGENSLIGESAYDTVGSKGIVALANGNYVVSSPAWSNGSANAAGAATWANGSAAMIGRVSPENSLVGTTAGDAIGKYGIVPLGSESYIVTSHLWTNGVASKSGAMTLASTRFRQAGVIEAYNSVEGAAADGGIRMRYAYDVSRDRLVVGRPADNVVSLFTRDRIFADSFR